MGETGAWRTMLTVCLGDKTEAVMKIYGSCDIHVDYQRLFAICVLLFERLQQ